MESVLGRRWWYAEPGAWSGLPERWRGLGFRDRVLRHDGLALGITALTVWILACAVVLGSARSGPYRPARPEYPARPLRMVS
ncbi:hypothetical protein P3L51_11625 [Streptomyces sp. PSRA5]|uniref:hypothetical protein n=1 Tax=Streptomyces panacea TaxID=3035064 RepID=UPI00339C8790